jgi:hypothetical protein
MVRSSSVATMSDHASRRLAQRNLTTDDVQYVYTHGRLHHRGKATFVHLGLRDIPAQDRREDRYRRLEVTTAYRNRQRGSRDIRRKLKRSIPKRAEARSSVI